MRSRIVVMVLAGALAGALLAPVEPASAKRPYKIRLKAPGHFPKAGAKWHIVVRIRKRSGAPLRRRAKALYKFLFEGQVVATRYPEPRGTPRNKPLRFRGGYQDDIDWPSAAVGIPLVFRIVVFVKGFGWKKRDYWVRVRA